MSADGPYFHGGAPWLRIGDELLPPSRTGARSMYDLDPVELATLRLETGLNLEREDEVTRRDVVYATTSLDEAELFARLYPHASGGAIYRVELGAPVEPDPDYLGVPCRSFRAPSGVVVAIVKTNLRPNAQTAALVRRGGFR
jgi:hypothetical protein